MRLPARRQAFRNLRRLTAGMSSALIVMILLQAETTTLI